jgi:hypothetical protein
MQLTYVTPNYYIARFLIEQINHIIIPGVTQFVINYVVPWVWVVV